MLPPVHHPFLPVLIIAHDIFSPAYIRRYVENVLSIENEQERSDKIFVFAAIQYLALH